MTKARTTGAKRRARKGGRPLKPGPRQPNGQPRRSRSAERDAARKANIVARCKAMGWLPRVGDDGSTTYEPTKEMAKRAEEPHLGCNAGRAVDAEKDRPALWAAITRIRLVYARWWQSIGAPPPYPKSVMLACIPEQFGSDGVVTDRQWDDRSEPERNRAAANAMMAVEQVLGMAGEGVRDEVKVVVLGDGRVRSMDRYLRGLRAIAG